MATRYLEVYSAYRNRMDYPEVGEFVIPFAVDNPDPYAGSYYSDAFPIYDFQCGRNDIGGYSLPPPPNAYFTSSDQFSPTLSPQLLSIQDGAYIGYWMRRFDTGELSFITEYDLSTASFTVQPPSKTPIVPGPAGSLYEMFDLSPIVLPPIAPVSLTKWGICLQNLDNYNRPTPLNSEVDVGYYVVWENAPAGDITYVRVTEYQADYHLAITDERISALGFYTGQRFTIRKALPLQKNYSLVDTGSRALVGITPVPGYAPEDYVGLLLYIIPINDTLRPDVAINKMTFNDFVYIIRSFDPATNQVTLDRPIVDGIYYQTAPNTVFNGRVYELLPRAVSSNHSLAYSGSTVSQANVACYKVELTNLTLPNVVLTTGVRVVNYPYVYLEFVPDGRDMRQGQNLIVSNNPNSDRALFICPVTNIVDPTLSTFIKIDANGMTQSIKFRPNSSFYFRVYLPDGTLFKPLQADNPSPLPANALLQVEAIFAFSQ